MQQYIEQSAPLAQLFTIHDSNTVADTLMRELNLMINTLAPAHITQLNKKHAPWVDTGTLKQIQLRTQHYRIAIQTNNADDW